MSGPTYLKSWLDACTGHEKFFLVIGAGIVNGIFLACGILTEPGYLTILGGSLLAYIGAKTYENTRPGADNATPVAQA